MVPNESVDADGYRVGEYTNILPDDKPFYCKWVNAHGRDEYTARQLGLNEPATITMRYHPAITEACELYKAGDPKPYEIKSLDNVEERNEWLEIKVERKVAAK